MNSASAPGSMLDHVLPGAKEDIYYYNSATSRKQMIPSISRTNFRQDLASKSGGASVITISPDAGVSHVILGLQMPEEPLAPVTFYSGYALNRGFLYNAIDKVQFRYGSSSQYELSGQQLLNIMLTTSGGLEESNRLLQLAGAECKAPADFRGDNCFAYGVIPLAHIAAQSSTDVPNPFSSELLSSPILITVFLKPLAQVFQSSPLYTGTVGTLPTAWSDAYIQVRQINALDRGQLEKPSASSRYGFPITFYQQVNSINLQSSSSSQTVNLTGFQSGSCKGVYAWCVDTADTANPNRYINLRDMQLSYQGNVLHDYRGISGTALDLLFTVTPSLIQNSVLTAVATTDPALTWTSAPEIDYFTHFPFAQKFTQVAAEHMEVKGLYVANGVMNLTLKTPLAKSTYKLYFMPYYSAALMMHQGACEYIF
jgi:hypothetical protein